MEYLYIQIFLAVVEMTIDCMRLVFLFAFPTVEDIINPLFSGVGFLVLVGMSATIFRSLLGISRSRALLSSLAGNVINYALIFAVILAATILYFLITRI